MRAGGTAAARGLGGTDPFPPSSPSSPTLHGQDSEGGKAETKQQVLQRHVSPAGRREQGPPRPHLRGERTLPPPHRHLVRAPRPQPQPRAARRAPLPGAALGCRCSAFVSGPAAPPRGSSRRPAAPAPTGCCQPAAGGAAALPQGGGRQVRDFSARRRLRKPQIFITFYVGFLDNFFFNLFSIFSRFLPRVSVTGAGPPSAAALPSRCCRGRLSRPRERLCSLRGDGRCGTLPPASSSTSHKHL